MRLLTVALIVLVFVAWGDQATAASARCVVVEKRGNILVMDCGERSEGFATRSKVKIKTDRDTETPATRR